MSGHEWQKSSFSGDAHQECVELATSPSDPTCLYLRESDDPAVVLATTPERLAALLRVARAQQP